MKTAACVLAGVALATGSVACADVYQGAGFIIPDNVPAGVSSVIEVSGGTAAITGVEVTLLGMTHAWVGDLNATLTSQRGTVFRLFIRVGRVFPSSFGDSSNLGGDYRFTDSATDSLWVPALALETSGVIPSGNYRTSDARAATVTSLNPAFAGQNSNGNWTLSISDSASGDVGRLNSWMLSIVPTPGSLAILGVAGVAAGRRRR